MLLVLKVCVDLSGDGRRQGPILGAKSAAA